MSTEANKIPQVKPTALFLLNHSATEQKHVHNLLLEVGITGQYISSLEEGLELVPNLENFLIFVDTSDSKNIDLFRKLKPSLQEKVQWIFVVSPELAPSKIANFYSLGALNVIYAPLSPLALQIQIRQTLSKLKSKAAKNYNHLTLVPNGSNNEKSDNLTLDHFLETPARKNLQRTKNLFIKAKPQNFDPVENKRIVRGYFDIANKFETPIVVWSPGQGETLKTHIKSITRWLGKATLYNPNKSFFTCEHDELFANIRLGPVSTFSKVKLIRGDFDSYELKIEMPETAFKLQRRNQLRCSVETSSSALVIIDGQKFNLKLADVSTGGCKLFMASEIPSELALVGHTVQLEIQVGNDYINAEAKISWTSPIEDSIGFKFQSLCLSNHSRIDAFVYNHSAEFFDSCLKKLSD